MEQYRFYQPTRIQFGTGSLDRIGEVTAAYGKKCMLVTTTNTEDVLRPLYDRVKSLLQRSGLEVVHFDKVVPNPTVQNIESAIELVNREQIEVLVAVGGGSSIDTAKTISLFYKVGQINWQQVIQTYTSPFESYDAPSDPVLPLIAVPTTAGTGSEVTQAMVISDPTQDAKDCIYHDKAFPKVSIIDPALTRTLPLCMTAITGFDAFTHAFESYLREFSSPYTMLIGLRAMALIVDALPKLMEDPQNLDLREKMSQASVFAGISLANASATLPHPLSEIMAALHRAWRTGSASPPSTLPFSAGSAPSYQKNVPLLRACSILRSRRQRTHRPLHSSPHGWSSSCAGSISSTVSVHSA